MNKCEKGSVLRVGKLCMCVLGREVGVIREGIWKK